MPEVHITPTGQRRTRTTVEERFWPKVDRSAGPDGCWPWTASRNPNGYGLFNANRPGWSGLASRVSWRLHFGEIPPGLSVCHHCDNPPCVNPAHLFLGTAADNAADMVAKGRAARTDNELSGKAKLTDAQVAEIRRLVAGGMRQNEVAHQFGVHPAHVCRIVSGKRRPTHDNPAESYEAGWLRRRSA